MSEVQAQVQGPAQGLTRLKSRGLPGLRSHLKLFQAHCWQNFLSGSCRTEALRSWGLPPCDCLRNTAVCFWEVHRRHLLLLLVSHFYFWCLNLAYKAHDLEASSQRGSFSALSSPWSFPMQNSRLEDFHFIALPQPSQVTCLKVPKL